MARNPNIALTLWSRLVVGDAGSGGEHELYTTEVYDLIFSIQP